MNSFVEIGFSGGVGRLTLNRPEKRNALTRDFIDELRGGLAELKSKADLRVLILAASGSVFCAGMDLDEMQQRAASPNGASEWQADSEVYCGLLSELLTLNVPTVAAVSGPALAGGVGMVLACDIVIAQDDSFFRLPEPMRGITAAMVTPLLVHRVGPGAATYMLLSGEKISAPVAQSFNLCHDVVMADKLPARVESLVASILTGSPAALAITKQHIAKCLPSDLLHALRASIAVSAAARETADAREGLTAFLEKRKPSWNS